jgi:hypothetical protein
VPVATVPGADYDLGVHIAPDHAGQTYPQPGLSRLTG